MIGKMADDKEVGEDVDRKVHSEAGDTEEDSENDEEQDDLSDSQFDDPEGFVDDITDEGKLAGFVCICSYKLPALWVLVYLAEFGLG